MAREHHHTIRRILLKVAVNIGLVVLLVRLFPSSFVLTGGAKAIVFVGLILTLVNWLFVPVLHLLAFPLKLFMWVAAFLLVNGIALSLTQTFVTALSIPGFSLMIQGGMGTWIVVSAVFGFCNWVLKAVVR